MSRHPGRRKKAQERRKKRQHRDDRKRASTLEELRSLAGRMARAGRWPLHGCRVGWAPEDPRKPSVLIARAGPTGITAVVLLVDLGCLGPKDCIVREDLSPGEYDELVESMEQGMKLETSPPDRALKLVETAARYARDLGFRSPPDCTAAFALFGDADPATCSEEFECGAGGLPFYVPGPEDDVREILRQLEERLGPQGFRYLLLPGDVEHEKEFPLDDDPDPSARVWGRLRRTEDWVTKALVMTAAVHFGERFLERAWNEFAREFARDDIQDGVGTLLDSWALTRRVPGCVPRERPAREEEERSAVEILLEENGVRLPEFERRLLEAMALRPFSFYVVRAVVPGERLFLADLFTGDEYEVRERSASQSTVAGAVLFARIVSLDSVAVLMGCGAYMIPPTFRLGLLKLRDFLIEKTGPLDEDKLFALEDLVREEFCQIVHAIRFPQPPRMQNTDGEKLHFHTLHYELACAPRAALDAMADLAFEWKADDFARESEFDSSGALFSIEFPWQGRGNRAHPSRTHTALGHIEIDGPRLTIEVNSAERSAGIQRELEQRLGARAALRKIEKKTLEQLRAERAEGEPAPGELRAPAPDAIMPETPALAEKMREKMREMAAAHWKSWFDHPVPALRNLSPREAARTPEGRELLDVLLADYAFHPRSPDDAWAPEVAALRSELRL